MKPTFQQQVRAVIYTRVSTDEQTKGYGLEYQLEDCRRAILQHGHELIHVYSDPGVSGTLEDRPGLNELRLDAQRGQFDVLYFWKSDRLARDEILQLTLYREFRRLGIETCSVSEPTMNDLMRGIYAVFGAEDLRNIKAKTFSGRLRAIRAGKWIGAPPYGYMKDANFRLVPNPEEAPWVRKFFEWLVEERLSLYALTRRAYEQRIPTWYDTRGLSKRVNGPTYWSSGALSHLLKRDYYATGQAAFNVRPDLGQMSGLRKPDTVREKIMVAIPPLVSLDLFQRAQEQVSRNAEYSPRAAKHTYLFTKKVRCGFCGLKLTATMNRVGSKDRYYRSNPRNRERRCDGCGCQSERAIDNALWPRIVAFFRDPDAFMASLETYRRRGTALPDIKSEQVTLDETDQRLQEQERALLVCELEGFYAAETLDEKKRQLQTLRRELAERRLMLQRRALAEEQRFATATSAASLYQTLRDKLESPSYLTKAHVYSLLIEKIILSHDKAEVWLNVPLTRNSIPSVRVDSERIGLELPNGGMDPTANVQRDATQLTEPPSMDCEAIAPVASPPDWGLLPQSGSIGGLVIFTARLQRTRTARTNKAA